DTEPFEQRYLRWHGWLIRYAVGGSTDLSHPAVLLVHGFGASCNQWEGIFRNLGGLRAATGATGATAAGDVPSAGTRVVALDLAGFGHSSKPPLTYSQYSWADCARDVALRVIGGPFFIAGNSIGG
ncbi:unnamed protein product, partial [Discosporangium mesarthrocarpum]